MTHVYKLNHVVKYDTKKPVPIGDVVRALEALEGLLEHLPSVVGGLMNVEIEGGEYFVTSIESGSLWETIAISLFFKDEEDLKKFLGKIRENGMLRHTIAGIAIGGLVAYGLHLAVGSKPAPSITANNNVIINIGAGELKMTPETFEAVVRTAVGDKKELAKNSLRFIAPAKSEPGARVMLGDSKESVGQIEISPESIAEAPTRLDLGKNERTEDRERAHIVIRANNLDSRKQGWAGKIDGIDKKLPIELDPTVDEMAVFKRDAVVADVTIVHAFRAAENQLVPTKIYIRKLHPEAE